jgi:hypothetical protein
MKNDLFVTTHWECDYISELVFSKFPEFFSETMVLPKHTEFVLKLRLDKNIKDFRTSRLQKISLEKEKELKNYIDKYLSLGYIVPSTSPIALPLLFVKKSDNTLRLCVDYRQLNQMLTSDAYSLPLIDQILDNLRGKKWFS